MADLDGHRSETDGTVVATDKTDDTAMHLFETSKPVIQLAAVYAGYKIYQKETDIWWELWDRMRPSGPGEYGSDFMEGIPKPYEKETIQQAALSFIADRIIRPSLYNYNVQEFIRKYWPPREGAASIFHRADNLEHQDDIAKLPPTRRVEFYRGGFKNLTQRRLLFWV